MAVPPTVRTTPAWVHLADARSGGAGAADVTRGPLRRSQAAVTLRREPSSDEMIALLPHRPPFRFVDSVDRCIPGSEVRARWLVTGDEPWLAGHFPGHPVVPGVLQLEALAQAGAVAVLADAAHAGRLPLFGGVEDVRFRRRVEPGDEVVLDVEIERLGGRGGWGRGRASVGGRETASGRLLFVLADRPEGAVPGAVVAGGQRRHRFGHASRGA